MKKSTAVALRRALMVALALVGFVVTRQQYLRNNEDRKREEAFHLYKQKNEVPVIPNANGWKSLEGYWLGDLAGNLRLLYRITSTYGQVFVYSLDQGGGMIPATGTRFDEDTGKITFYFSTIGGVHQAFLDKDGQEIRGTWSQGVRLPLNMRKFVPADDEKSAAVPREYRFLLEKVNTGDPNTLLQMEGFWTGYLDTNDEDNQDEPPELVILQVEKVSDELVEPKLFLPDEFPWPCGIKSFIVLDDGQTKIVLSDPGAGSAIFDGRLEGKTLTGVVKYDDTDTTEPLTLVWSKQHP